MVFGEAPGGFLGGPDGPSQSGKMRAPPALGPPKRWNGRLTKLGLKGQGLLFFFEMRLPRNPPDQAALELAGTP